MLRGDAWGTIFYDAADRDSFVNRAGRVLVDEKADCYAFALLPNHVHLLLRAGATTVSDIMRRLLTGYSVCFNKRHKRCGHLFPSRYKSVLCEEQPYILQLVRYIHLNPLRANVVPDLDSLDSYPYSGHSTMMGRCERLWFDSAYVLGHFGQEPESARLLYRDYVQAGIVEGKRNDLTGGGFARSSKGWLPSEHSSGLKSDERILGSSRFVAEIMESAKEKWGRAHSHKFNGADFTAMQRHVARLFHLNSEEILLPGKYRIRVAARSVLCYFLVRELGMTATAVADRLGLGQPAVSIAVERGEAIVKERGLKK